MLEEALQKLEDHRRSVSPHTQYRDSPLQSAFNSLDMPPIIEKYQPTL